MSDPRPCNLIGNQKIFHLAAGRVTSCCEAYPQDLDTSKDIKDYVAYWLDQRDLLNQGIKIPQCETCWKVEDQNKTSFRQQALKSTQEDVYELLISNACNQMCSYCSPKYSSTWQESIESHGPFENISASAKQNQQLLTPRNDVDFWVNKIRDYISTSDNYSVVLKLLGGEPLIQNKNLQALLELDSNKVKLIQLHTNLSPPNNKFLEWVLKNFEPSRLKFIVSLDATPQYNHVPRGKFNAVEFDKNLNLIKEAKINFQFLSVLSVLSIFDLENFMSWLALNHYTNSFQRLNNPECLSPELVPLEFRQKIYDKIKDFDLPDVVIEILTKQTTQSNLRLFEQYNYLTQYFERVNIDVLTIKNPLFVEYWTWLSSKFSK